MLIHCQQYSPLLCDLRQPQAWEPGWDLPGGPTECPACPHHGDGDPEAQTGHMATRQVRAPAGPLGPSCEGQGPGVLSLRPLQACLGLRASVSTSPRLRGSSHPCGRGSCRSHTRCWGGLTPHPSPSSSSHRWASTRHPATPFPTSFCSSNQTHRVLSREQLGV